LIDIHLVLSLRYVNPSFLDIGGSLEWNKRNSRKKHKSGMRNFHACSVLSFE